MIEIKDSSFLSLLDSTEKALRHIGKIMVVLDDADKNKSLNTYKDKESYFDEYIDKYGYHFNDKLCDWICSNMYKKNKQIGSIEKIMPFTKDEVDSMITRYNVSMKPGYKNNHDYVYLANMCKADYYGSSITDDYHLVLFVKNTLEDVDAEECSVFKKWLSSVDDCKSSLDWKSFI